MNLIESRIGRKSKRYSTTSLGWKEEAVIIKKVTMEWRMQRN